MYNWKRNGVQGVFTPDNLNWNPNAQSQNQLAPVIESLTPLSDDLTEFSFTTSRNIDQGVLAYGIQLEIKHPVTFCHYEFYGTAIAHHEEGSDFPMILQPFVSYHTQALTTADSGNIPVSSRFIPANSSIGNGSTHSSCSTAMVLGIADDKNYAGAHFIAGWALTYPKDGTLDVAFSGDMSFKRLGTTTLHTHDPHM